MSTPRSILTSELLTARLPCITASFQAECVVLLHMLRELRPDIPVLFIDTVHHFADTNAYRDRLVEEWRLNLVIVRSAEPRPGEWRTSTDACCARHKIGPLFLALDDYDTWFTALRRDQSPSRANLAEAAPFRLPSGRTLRKVSPLAAWSMPEVESYAARHAIPLLPLYARGYTSIGCEPCTVPPPDPSDPRSGRWLGQKLECGIHIQGDA